jgi:hypothetical protein
VILRCGAAMAHPEFFLDLIQFFVLLDVTISPKRHLGFRSFTKLFPDA